MERNHNRKGNGETEPGYAVVDRARKKERKNPGNCGWLEKRGYEREE